MSDGEHADQERRGEDGRGEDGRREDGRGEDLAEELRVLGRGMRVPDVDGETMAERVLAQLLADAAPVPVPASAPDPVVVPVPTRAARVRRLLRRRWRVITAGLSGLLVVLVLTPPVRAAVADWFDFGGVQVRYDPKATPSPAARVPDCADPMPIEEAARRAGFRPRVPAELGAPDRVSLAWASAGRPVVSLCWTDPGGPTVRLDEFPAGLDPAFSKRIRHMPEWVPLRAGESNESTGLWFAEPHLLRFRMLDGQGAGWTHSARTAGPTFLWDDSGPDGGTGERLTLRLEGVDSVERAKAVAQSIR
ncbi:hypothetical protein [Streptomyces sp. NPDC006645]|uniref:hypothetical protein n=1 Tax=unclassified Streptomyces TaxID=2593676 RepID=UPI0033A3D6CA